MRFFLDDTRDPKDAFELTRDNEYRSLWLTVRSFNEFKSSVLEFGMPTVVSFDFDLGSQPSTEKEQPSTGLDCAQWLKDYCKAKTLKIPRVLVHSEDPKGAQLIKECLGVR